MRQWGQKVRFGASTRSNVGVERMFEHCEAVLTPVGGSPVAQSPNSIAQPREDWTRNCSEGLAASQNAPNGSYGSYDHSTCMGNA